MACQQGDDSAPTVSFFCFEPYYLLEKSISNGMSNGRSSPFEGKPRGLLTSRIKSRRLLRAGSVTNARSADIFRG